MTEQQFINEYPLLESDFRGAYDLQQSYPAGSIVRHEGSAWRAVYSASAGEVPSTTSDTWSLLVEAGKEGPPGADGRDGVDGQDGQQGPPGNDGADGHDGEDGAQGPSGADGRDGVDGQQGPPGADGEDGRGFLPSGEWNSGTHYIPDSIVTYQGSTYRARSVNVGQAPSVSSTVWELWAKAGDLTQAVADARYAFSDAPSVNIMPDSGRFAGKMNSLATRLASGAAFVPSTFIGGYNGTTIENAGRFFYDNSSNGGPGNALDQTVNDLLTAMGRITQTHRRFGTEFFIAGYTMGSGVQGILNAPDGVRRYLACSNASRSLFGVGNRSTVMMWIRCTAGSVQFRHSALSGNAGIISQRKNGMLLPDGAPNGGLYVKPSDGWIHVHIVGETFVGNDGPYPYLYAEPGSAWQIALPVFFFGRQAPTIHNQPYATINELTA